MRLQLIGAILNLFITKYPFQKLISVRVGEKSLSCRAHYRLNVILTILLKKDMEKQS
jgi:hypothetical protein